MLSPINIIHLRECESTQDYLRQYLQDSSENNTHHKEILVTCDSQTEGHGRRGNKWIFFDHSLAFSFTIPKTENLTLIPLEIGVLISLFYKKEKELIELKWPNDLMLNDKKCGGIIAETYKDKIIIGVGINRGALKDPVDIPYPVASLSNSKSTPKDIVEFINNNRMDSHDTITKWKELSMHLNKRVTLIDDKKEFYGVFKGIGTFGQAIIDEKEFFSGSLVL